MARVEFRAVGKKFGSVVALENIDFAVADREFLVLLGPSGCGKTTLLRMLAGLESVTSGDIRIGDRRVNDNLPKERDVAMVFQSYALYPHMTVYQNIEYPLRIRRIEESRRRREVLAAAGTVELENLLDRYPNQLSGGQRQRVAVARAIVRRPQVFLMDEPLSNLDAKLRVKMRSELKHLHHEIGITTIYVTHDQTEALTLADRVAVLDRGRIMQIATPRDLYGQPANQFVAGFVGSPAMNFLVGRLQDGDFVTEGVRVGGVGGGTRTGVTLGFRPEHAAVVEARDAVALSAELYSVEIAGETGLATARFGEDLLSVAVPASFAGRIGEPIHVRIDVPRVHLFDAGTGDRLSIGSRPTTTART
jgi:multiple sugar transport system ATP-binding protein